MEFWVDRAHAERSRDVLIASGATALATQPPEESCEVVWNGVQFSTAYFDQAPDGWYTVQGRWDDWTFPPDSFEDDLHELQGVLVRAMSVAGMLAMKEQYPHLRRGRPLRPKRRRGPGHPAAAQLAERSVAWIQAGPTAGDWHASAMRPTHIFPNLTVSDIDEAKDFYTGFLGLSTEEFNMGWVARFSSAETGVSVQLVTKDATSPEDSQLSVATPDVDAAYDDAQRLGYEIVHPLTTEPWGVRRFLVRSPDGTIVNVVNHRE